MIDTASKLAKEEEEEDGEDEKRAIFGGRQTQEELIRNLNELNGADGEDTKIIEEDDNRGGGFEHDASGVAVKSSSSVLP